MKNVERFKIRKEEKKENIGTELKRKESREISKLLLEMRNVESVRRRNKDNMNSNSLNC